MKSAQRVNSNDMPGRLLTCITQDNYYSRLETKGPELNRTLANPTFYDSSDLLTGPEESTHTLLLDFWCDQKWTEQQKLLLLTARLSEQSPFDPNLDQ